MRKEEQSRIERKVEWCMRRWAGLSIYSIAREFHVQPQTIDAMLRSLPSKRGIVRGRPALQEQRCRMICEKYFQGESLELIAEESACTLKDIIELFGFLRSRKPRNFESLYYPDVTTWMSQNGYSIRAFSETIGVQAEKVSDILHGRKGRQMDYRTAMKIKKRTGLQFRQIYRVQIENAPELFTTEAKGGSS